MKPDEPGVPDGWLAEEAEHLRFGVWRFYEIVDPEGEDSVRDDNWVTRDGVAMDGIPGLREYMADLRPHEEPDRVPPELMAAHVGHFIIRGASRETAVVRVVTDTKAGAAPPTASIDADGRFRLRAWYQRDGYRVPADVIVDQNGDVAVQWGDLVVYR